MKYLALMWEAPAKWKPGFAGLVNTQSLSYSKTHTQPDKNRSKTLGGIPSHVLGTQTIDFITNPYTRGFMTWQFGKLITEGIEFAKIRWLLRPQIGSAAVMC